MNSLKKKKSHAEVNKSYESNHVERNESFGRITCGNRWIMWRMTGK